MLNLHFTHLRFSLLSALLLLVCTGASSQTSPSKLFGKGIDLLAKDSSYYIKFSTRIQNRFDFKYSETSDPDFTKKFSMRRARLKFDGWVLSTDLSYKIELDVVDGKVLDAVLMWNPVGNFSIWVGQTKLPGNRERVVSSQKLQFVDRSLLNEKFNIDRDKGVQLRHHHKIGKMVVREAFSVSQGEGRLSNESSTGADYTGRIEILPFGAFQSKGDYFCADLKREKKPKLALGVTYDYNDNAMNTMGQLGPQTPVSKDLSSWFFDMMFKYNGLSLMSEYVEKSVYQQTSPITGYDSLGTPELSYYTGTGFNIQCGYLFPCNWEIAFRYSQVMPEEITEYAETSAYTTGISKYISDHNLKVQSDFTIQQQAEKEILIARLQVEMSF